MERRHFITTTALGSLMLGCTKNTKVTSINNSKKQLRFVHITDMHIYKDIVPEQGISNLFKAISELDEKPDFILNTGDNVMDSLKHSKEEVAELWDAWNKYYKNNLPFKSYNCIGNHDVWGWGLKDTSIKNDPLYGKNWAIKQLGLENRYYSFEQNGWKTICLDSSFFDRNNHAYTAKLDEEQFKWLKETLDNTPKETNVLIASHIPILAPSVFFDGENEKTGNWQIPGSWMHIDARRIKDLLKNYSNVKLAVSGHVHLVDEGKYLNVDYVCNGAACGGWWKGNYQEFSPAFAVIDLFEDGTFNNQLIYYNWK